MDVGGSPGLMASDFARHPIWPGTGSERENTPARLSRLYQPRNRQSWLLIVLNVLSSAISFILRTYELPALVTLVLAGFAIANVVIGIRIALRLMSGTAPQLPTAQIISFDRCIDTDNSVFLLIREQLLFVASPPYRQETSMKSIALLAAVLTLGLTLAAGDAEAAKRLGSGKSSGMQRQMTPPAKAPDAAPAPAAAASAKAPAAPQAQAGRSWMGPIAGLAAGLGLAALASHFGFGEELASFLMMALIGLAVMAAIGFFMRKRAAARPPALAGAQGIQYAAGWC
ncbi:MAG: hypothetical protein MZW92_42620 [Comamonadaceae bacterium]|nr:hypothetical protein [Comamonadaceae bacterium]